MKKTQKTKITANKNIMLQGLFFNPWHILYVTRIFNVHQYWSISIYWQH